MTEKYVFWPRNRCLFDVLMCWAVLFLILSLFKVLPPEVIYLACGIPAAIALLLWVFWIRPTFRIVIADGKVYGPSLFLQRIAIPLNKIDFRKLLYRKKKQKYIRYRNLYSVDGQRILVWHALLGKLAAYEIMEIVEKNPYSS